MSGESELLRGTIKTWDDARGYGFIEPHEKGKDVFFHIKQWTLRDERPTLGRQVFYIQEQEVKGKARASLVRPLVPLKPTEETVSARSILQGGLGIFVLSAAGVLILLFGLILNPPIELTIAYLVSSLLTYQLYKFDKQAAGTGQSRVPEVTLHFFDLLCGWPGGFVAQQRLRHKTQKATFRMTYWITVFLNLCVVGGYVILKVGLNYFGR